MIWALHLPLIAITTALAAWIATWMTTDWIASISAISALIYILSCILFVSIVY